MTRNDKAFISFVRRECDNHGIYCDLRNTKYLVIEGKMKVSGYFCEYDKILACSMNSKDALSVLVHEYAHMTQWLDREPLFVDVTPSIIAVDKWLQDKQVHNIDKHIAAVRDMELNNEKRAVKLIRKHNLSLDIPQYIKGANAYIHFYNYLLISRRWIKNMDNAPYRNERIMNAMSPKFNMKYSSLPKRIEKLYTEENI